MLTVAVAVGATGCGGGGNGTPQVASARTAGPAPSSSAATGGDLATYLDSMRAWVACLRGEGVQASDPDATGQVTFQGDAAALKADPKFQAAQQKCRSLEPPVPDSVLQLRQPPLTPEQIEARRQYSQCMQSHGAPDYPDPGPDGYLPRGASWNQTSAGARQASRACASIIGDPTDQPTQG